jgi:NitT/TauT family transport system ATP-binding protein
VDAIRAVGLAKHFDTAGGPVEALRHVTLAVPESEFCCLVGPSGCGKTTFLRILAGLETPSDGTLDLHAPDAARPATAVIFQETSIFPWMTVLENAAFGLEARGIPRGERGRRTLPLLRKVGLTRFQGAFPHQLSGGMKQRVSIARAFVTEPQILLMDEPFAALDAQNRTLLQEELVRLWEERPTTVVFITHSLEEALLMGDRIVVMTAQPGRIKEIIPVPFGRPRDTRRVRATEAYGRLAVDLWKILEDEVMRARSESGEL